MIRRLIIKQKILGQHQEQLLFTVHVDVAVETPTGVQSNLMKNTVVAADNVEVVGEWMIWEVVGHMGNH